MIETSILIPQRNCGPTLHHLIPALQPWLERMGGGEMILVDDASDAGTLAELHQLCESFPGLRTLRFEQAVGISASLSAGLAAVRCENVLVLHPAYAQSLVDCLDCCEGLLGRLTRADLVVARPRHRGLSKMLHRIGRLPRYMLLGLEVRDPECLCWAAKREAVHGLELPRGMYRYLSTLVAARGYRVGELVVDWPERPRVQSEGLPNPGDLLCAWWLKRRWPSGRYQWLSDEQPATPIGTWAQPGGAQAESLQSGAAAGNLSQQESCTVLNNGAPGERRKSA